MEKNDSATDTVANKNIKPEEILRISISKSADEALCKVVDRVNEEYEGGRVNRTQVANWILIRSPETLTELEIRDIRTELLDEFAFMEAFMRKAKKTGKLPSELRSFMNRQLGLDDAPKKKSKKPLPENLINDDIIIDESES